MEVAKRYLCLLLALLTLTACGTRAPTWQEQYDLGVRYLRDGNYEEAILAFSAAIEIDPKRTETYVSLAEAYVAADDDEKAVETLLQGYEVTGDRDLQTRADEVAAEAEARAAAEKSKRAYAAYLDLLLEHKARILDYSWQYGLDSSGVKAATPVAIVDICGDETPELLFLETSWGVAQYLGTEGYHFATLSIYTWEERGPRLLYTRVMDEDTIRFRYYYGLFRAGGESDLWITQNFYAETTAETIHTRFGLNGNGTELVPAEEYISGYETELLTGEDIYTWTHNGMEIGETEYRQAVSGLEGTGATWILENSVSFASGEAHACVSMGFQAAIRYLAEQLGEDADAVLRQAALDQSQLREIVEGHGNIGIWEYADYDGDGLNEAFALVAGGYGQADDAIQAIYYVDSFGVLTELNSPRGMAYYEAEDHFRSCGGKGFFWSDYGASGSGWSSFVFGVKDGAPYELDISGQIQGFYQDERSFYTTENDFSEGYHTYPEVELIYDSNTQQFLKGNRRD